MTGQEPADDETDSEPVSSTQATLDEFSQTREDQQSSILDDEMFVEEVRESIEDGAGTVDNPFYGQSSALRAFENLQQPMAEIRSGVLRDVQQAFDGQITRTVRELQQASRAARLARRAVGPALATSTVASSTVAGVDPAVVQTMGQLPIQEMTEAVRVMAELNTQPLARMANTVSSSVLQEVSQEFQSLSTLAVTQLAEQVAQQMRDVMRIAEQATHLREGVAGVGTMGAVAARPGTVQGFDLPKPGRAFEEQEVSWPLGQSVSVPQRTPVVEEQEFNPAWWVVDRVRDRSSDIILVVATETAGSTFTYLAYHYPSHQPYIAYTGHFVLAMLQVALILVLTDE